MANRNSSMRNSLTMPQLHYTREDIQEQYLASSNSNSKLTKNQIRRGRRRIEERQLKDEQDRNDNENKSADYEKGQRKRLRARSSGPEFVGGNEDDDYDNQSDESGGSSENCEPRDSRRNRKRSRRQRAQSASLFSACFTIPNIGSMITSQIASSSSSTVREKRSILQHLGLASSSKHHHHHQRPISASKTLTNLQSNQQEENSHDDEGNFCTLAKKQAEQKLPTTASGQQQASSSGLRLTGGANRKHVSFGGGGGGGASSSGRQQTGSSENLMTNVADKNNDNNVIIRNYADQVSQFMEGPPASKQPPIYLLSQQSSTNNVDGVQQQNQLQQVVGQPQVIYHNRAQQASNPQQQQQQQQQQLQLQRSPQDLQQFSPAQQDIRAKQHLNSSIAFQGSSSSGSLHHQQSSNQQPQQPPARQLFYKPTVPTKTQATQTDITAYHLMTNPTPPLSSTSLSSGLGNASGSQQVRQTSRTEPLTRPLPPPDTPSVSNTTGQSPSSLSSLRLRSQNVAGDNNDEQREEEDDDDIDFTLDKPRKSGEVHRGQKRRTSGNFCVSSDCSSNLNDYPTNLRGQTPTNPQPEEQSVQMAICESVSSVGGARAEVKLGRGQDGESLEDEEEDEEGEGNEELECGNLNASMLDSSSNSSSTVSLVGHDSTLASALHLANVALEEQPASRVNNESCLAAGASIIGSDVIRGDDLKLKIDSKFPRQPSDPSSFKAAAATTTTTTTTTYNVASNGRCKTDSRNSGTIEATTSTNKAQLENRGQTETRRSSKPKRAQRDSSNMTKTFTRTLVSRASIEPPSEFRDNTMHVDELKVANQIESNKANDQKEQQYFRCDSKSHSKVPLDSTNDNEEFSRTLRVGLEPEESLTRDESLPYGLCAPGSPPSLSEASSQTTDASIAKQIIDIGHSLELQLAANESSAAAAAADAAIAAEDYAIVDSKDDEDDSLMSLRLRNVCGLSSSKEQENFSKQISSPDLEPKQTSGIKTTTTSKTMMISGEEDKSCEMIRDNAVLTSSQPTDEQRPQTRSQSQVASGRRKSETKTETITKTLSKRSSSSTSKTSSSAGVRLQAGQTIAEQRRDDFLQLVEHDYELMAAIAEVEPSQICLPLTSPSSIAIEQVNSTPTKPSQAPLERSSTSTLSTRHHSYCSFDDFNTSTNTTSSQIIGQSDATIEIREVESEELKEGLSLKNSTSNKTRLVEQEELATDEDDVIRPPDRLINSSSRSFKDSKCEPLSLHESQLYSCSSTTLPQQHEQQQQQQQQQQQNDKLNELGPLESLATATNGSNKEAGEVEANERNKKGEEADEEVGCENVNDSDNKPDTIKLDCKSRFMEVADHKIQDEDFLGELSLVEKKKLQSASSQDSSSSSSSSRSELAQVEQPEVTQKMISIRRRSDLQDKSNLAKSNSQVSSQSSSSSFASSAHPNEPEKEKTKLPVAADKAEHPSDQRSQQSRKIINQEEQEQTKRKSIASGASSPPTTVSELDQDEELSTPSFVDSYRNRLAEVCQMADSVVGQLIGEYLTKPNNESPPDDANHSNQLPAPPSNSNSNSNSNLNSTSSTTSPSSSSSSSTEPPDAASLEPFQSSDFNRDSSFEPDSSSTSTSVTGHSYICCHAKTEEHFNAQQTRPKLPEKPAHLKTGLKFIDRTNVYLERSQERPDKKPEVAAALAVAATSIGAAAAAYQEKKQTSCFVNSNQEDYKQGQLRQNRETIEGKDEASLKQEKRLVGIDDDTCSAGTFSVSVSSSTSSTSSQAASIRKVPEQSASGDFPEANKDRNEEPTSVRKVTETQQSWLASGELVATSSTASSCVSLQQASNQTPLEWSSGSFEQLPSPVPNSSSSPRSSAHSTASTVAPLHKHRQLNSQDEDDSSGDEQQQQHSTAGSQSVSSSSSSSSKRSSSSSSGSYTPTDKRDGSQSVTRDSNALTELSEAHSDEQPLLNVNNNSTLPVQASSPVNELLQQQQRSSQELLSTVSEVSEELSGVQLENALTTTTGVVVYQGVLRKNSDQLAPSSPDSKSQANELDQAHSEYTLSSEVAAALIIAEQELDGELEEEEEEKHETNSEQHSTIKHSLAEHHRQQSLEQRRRSAASNATTGSGVSSISSVLQSNLSTTRMKSPVDCPYVHDIQPLSSPPPPLSSLSSCSSSKQQANFPMASPALGSDLSHRQSRLSHDDTMEAIEDDVEGEELEMEQQRNLAEIIEPPVGFASSNESHSSHGGALERVCTPADSIKEEEEEDDDEDEESSISVSQRGVIVTSEQRTSKPKSSSSSSELDDNDDDDDDENAEATPRHSPCREVSLEQAPQQAPPSKEQLDDMLLARKHSIEKLGETKKSLSSESTGTRAILEHLSRHHPASLPAEEEPIPPLEQSRSIIQNPHQRRESWRREAETNRMSSTQRIASNSPIRDLKSINQMMHEPNETSYLMDEDLQENTGTMKRKSRKDVTSNVSIDSPKNNLDSNNSETQTSQSETSLNSNKPRIRGPPLYQLKANETHQENVSGKQSASSQIADTSICSSCSCLETSFDQTETQQPVEASGSGLSKASQKSVASSKAKLVSSSSGSAWMSLEEGSVFTENYWLSHWLYISEQEEREIWKRAIDMGSNSQAEVENLAQLVEGMPKEMTELSRTQSETNFSSKYKSTTRKMIHRRATIEMYKRMASNDLKKEKRVEICKSNGEFGFRIHGSRPVVVSAIERGTSAESCGLQVGDLIYAINGTNILEMAHSEVVKLAHKADSSQLVLDLVPTNDFLRGPKYIPTVNNKRYEPIVTGFLMRLSSSTAQPLLVELQKKVAHLSGVSAQQRAAKLTEVLRLAWRQRYFVLRSDNCLYWYKSLNDIEPCGGINLQGFSASLTNEFSEPSYVIRLVKYGGQPHYFGTNNICDIQTWIDAINKAATEANQNDPYMKRTLTIAHKSPKEIPEADCAGYLYKFTHKKLSGAHWRAAYFVLKDACLYLYRDQEPSEQVGKQASAVYYLHGYRVRSKHIEQKKHTFELTPPNRKTMRPMYLMAASEMDKKRWIAALEYSIERWLEID